MASGNRYQGKRKLKKLPPGVREAGGVFAGTGVTVGRKSALAGNSRGRPADVVKERARGSFARRVAILENIADGKIKTTVVKTGPKGVVEETYSATPSDRLKAMAMLAKYGGIDREVERGAAGELMDEAMAAQAIAAAMRDPTVRSMLERERPDILLALGEGIEDVEFEVLPDAE